VRRDTSPVDVWEALSSDFSLRASARDARDAAAAAQALAAARLAACPEGGALLDVPCGFGRHSIPLARAGYKVTGVDRSGALLGEAQRRGQGIEFVQADYRQLPFADDSFDAALNLFTSLGYLGDEEDVKVLAEIRRVLRPGAKLLIETSHRDALVKRWSDNNWRLMGEGRVLLENRTFDPAAGVAQTTQTLVEPDGSRESRTWSVRCYTATELAAMVERAGFAEFKCWGGFEFEPLTATSRLVIVATNLADW
jgi:ubiquinone/menaquinone biosynthesis C-methylase UbiE